MQALSIAGSDPSSGAGIQGDIKTFSALGIYGLTVITAITSQNTLKFHSISPIPPNLLKSQIRSVIEDFQIDAIKIGVVYDVQTIKSIHMELKDLDIPIVLDPIFRSTTGGKLQKDDAFDSFKKLLLPLAYVITPNLVEAEKISGMKLRNLLDVKKAAKKIQSMGAKNVIIKGGHFSHGRTVSDVLLDGNKFHTFSHKRIESENHGGGCTFSAALCAHLAGGKRLKESTDAARLFTLESIKGRINIGRGLPLTSSKSDSIRDDIAKAILQFISMRTIHEHIPECQTNFVYARQKASSISEIIGIEGRIVKTGNAVVQSGQLKYGGSKHVASAVLEVSKKFPNIRSACNLKLDDRIIKKARAKKFHVLSYDRMREPKMTSSVEGRTISWGVRSAISKSKISPDMIFHKGGVGKEPMVILFGKDPADVIQKLNKLI